MIDTFTSFFNLLLEGDLGAIGALVGMLAMTILGVMFSRIATTRQRVKRRLLFDNLHDKRANSATSAKAEGDVQKIVAKIDRALGEQSEAKSKLVRADLMMAGYHDPRAVGIFFAIRAGLSLFFGILALVVAPFVVEGISTDMLFGSGIGAATLAYFLPLIVLKRMIKRVRTEHMDGFPDFMDLMIVCAQAGLAMEAGLARIAGELRHSYPSLAKNTYLATLEIRSGKQLSKAIEAFAARLGLDEARSLATLLQQSEEIGASVSDSLRAFSEDMRNKRMMKAEEKAYALPAKLVVPLTLFVFPVLLVVVILPGAIGVMRLSS